jgi:hypothetical protein
MKKDARLTFRIDSELKKTLETIALSESRSVAQVCGAFLKAGSEAYEKEAPKFLSRFLSKTKGKSERDGSPGHLPTNAATKAANPG